MQKFCLLLIVLLGLNGCGTVVKLIDPTESYSSYAGTKYDLEMAKRWGLPILDLPFSLYWIPHYCLMSGLKKPNK